MLIVRPEKPEDLNGITQIYTVQGQILFHSLLPYLCALGDLCG